MHTEKWSLHNWWTSYRSRSSESVLNDIEVTKESGASHVGINFCAWHSRNSLIAKACAILRHVFAPRVRSSTISGYVGRFHVVLWLMRTISATGESIKISQWCWFGKHESSTQMIPSQWDSRERHTLSTQQRSICACLCFHGHSSEGPNLRSSFTH